MIMRILNVDIRQIDHFLASNLRHLRTGSGFSSATGRRLTNIFGAPAAMTLTTRDHNHSHASQTQVCKKRFTPKRMVLFAGWSKKHRLNFLQTRFPKRPSGPARSTRTSTFIFAANSGRPRVKKFPERTLKSVAKRQCFD
jgi:hypothetical protein